MPITLDALVELLRTGSIVIVLGVFIYLLVARWLVTRGELDAGAVREAQLREERDLAYARLDRLSDVLEATLKVKVPG